MTFYTFTPPTTENLSTWEAEASPLANRLMGHFHAGTRVHNVWIYSDNTVSETQPPYWEQNPSDPNGAYVARVFYGGGTYQDVTQAQRDLLVAAGYSVS
jgi:hypothetical protein